MMTVQEYVQRIPSKITWSRSLEGAGRDCKNLERLIEGAAPAKLRKRPAPEKWSAAEILAHLADAKIVVSWRLRSILGGLGTPIQAFDQGAWVAAGTLRKTRRTQVARAVPRIDANLALHKNLTHRVHDGRPQRQPPGVTRGNPRIPKIIRRFGFASGPPTEPTTHSD
jgi:hypothetical protein